MPSALAGDARDRLILAAIDVIASGRHTSMPLRTVAERAGVTTGAIQHHFANKEGLLLAVLQRHGERIVERLSEGGGGELPPPPGVARAILLEFLPLDDERRTEARVSLAFEGAAANDERLAGAYREQYKLLADLLAEHLPGSSLADVELVLASMSGLRTDLLLGRLTHDRALTLLDHLLARASPDEGPAG